MLYTSGICSRLCACTAPRLNGSMSAPFMCSRNAPRIATLCAVKCSHVAGCRPDALVAREKALVHYKNTKGESKLFELASTNPWRLRKHSAFLSLHFGSLGLFALLLLGYSLLSIYPLADWFVTLCLSVCVSLSALLLFSCVASGLEN